MQQISQSIDQDLVLIGGGHSHAIVLQLLGIKPLPGVRLTLIANTPHAPYSGMLPGYVAGFYKFDECHINLRKLAQ
ncbi:MAG: FAD-dependent oxidoreductase, partial [Cyanobacteriota bacterium]